MSSNELDFIKKHKRKKIIIKISQISIIISFFILWQLLSSFKIINPFIFSSPIKILNTIKNLYISNDLFIHIFTTLKEIILAFILGFIISFILAILLYLSNTFYKIIDPFLNILNSLPKISLGPILIIWFGANTSSIIIMALLINILVCTETLYVGFISCNKYLLLLFKSFKVNKIYTIIHLVIPSSLENITTSLKLNISMTLIGLLPPVGEKIFFNKCYSRY
ncbi:MAG: ABC transporter permease subunit [Bacilli bacterium]|nr:ABC transporter permease subunit [Bacilli bacterium]